MWVYIHMDDPMCWLWGLPIPRAAQSHPGLQQEDTVLSPQLLSGSFLHCVACHALQLCKPCLRLGCPGIWGHSREGDMEAEPRGIPLQAYIHGCIVPFNFGDDSLTVVGFYVLPGCIAQGGLGLTMELRLVLNSQSCLCFPSHGIRGLLQPCLDSGLIFCGGVSHLYSW